MFAVQGAIINKSAPAVESVSCICSSSPVILTIGVLPVAQAIISGVINFIADLLITGITSAPCRINSLAI